MEDIRVPFKYEEKPSSALLSRRTFLKITGVLVSVLAIGGFAATDVIKKRNKYITMRQAGLYKDDQRLQGAGLAASFENPTVQRFYKEFAGHPLSKISEQLLHTKGYVVRSDLIMQGGKL
ncbi:iron hydrogenase small subunit [Thermodesulfobium narugense DSM 14796]|uniref:Iron hydrogenase small subunit n=1 Tax=Thermodesulfobium narugense DSM 14796 TaxID=747365 RepID=M1E8S4_9BACT|nr:iron hydrogenase small subunit [Thermodesulfobium narugense]AEE15130.1 iron hydrogenase small subunit [Thermodesulfobium narugense DSM 14796]